DDPALATWFAREQAFDRAFAETAQSAPVPADLRASIFAAVEQSTGRTSTRREEPARRWLVQRPLATVFAALAAAASIALLAVLVWPRPGRVVALDDLIAAALAQPPAEVDARELAGRPLADVRDWLASRSAPVPSEIPPALAALPTDGAAVVVLHGVTSSVVTFEARGFARAADEISATRDRRLALFTLPRQSCSTAGITRQPIVREQAGHTVAVWRDATSVYVLAVDAPAEDLRRFLRAGGFQVTHADPQPGAVRGPADAS
ncbi:MAG: hypothetical protein IAE82_04535, partial [Opitutaceae bacterium]|nr:hypothetical protein [Opitutaceae bacterium]